MTQIAANQADKVRTCLEPVRDRVLDIMLPSNKVLPSNKQGMRPSNVQIAGEWHSDVFINPNLTVKKQERQFYFTFKQVGSRLFGDVLYVYPPREPTWLPYGLSGEINGNKISFEVVVQFSNGPEKESFYGEVIGREIHFVYQPENARPSEIKHPSPGRPEADCRPCHQQRSREEYPSSEGPVDPPAEKKTEQCRDNDRPAENADLAEPGAERGFGIGTTFCLALRGSLRGAFQAIEIGSPHEAASRSPSAAGAGLGRKYLTS